jgi:hypothetical protein
MEACLELRNLLREFVNAVSDYERTQSAQSVAFLNGRSTLFDDQIEIAAARKEQAQQAMLAHRQELRIPGEGERDSGVKPNSVPG